MKNLKNILLIVFLGCFISQCSTSDSMDVSEDTSDDTTDDAVEVPIFLMGFNVEDDYYNSNTNVDVFLSDIDGNIIAQNTLSNNTNISLEAIFDLENLYDLTLSEKITVSADIVLYRVITYKNVRPETYSLNRNRGNIHNDEINLSIENIGGLPEIYTSSSGGGGSGTSTNGGSQQFSGNLVNSPGSYYFAISNGIESAPRYFYREVVNANDSYTLNYEELPSTDLIQFNFPTSDNSFTLLGISRDPSIGIHFVTNTFENSFGQENYDLYLPDIAFTSYYLSYSLRENNITYSANKILPEIDGDAITINRDFGFDVSRSAIDDFSMTTFGDYDGYGVTYEWENQPLTRRITYTISGKSTTTIEFNTASLFNNIFEDDTEVNASLFVDPPKVGLSRNNSIDSYSSYLSQSVRKIFTYDVGKIIESISN